MDVRKFTKTCSFFLFLLIVMGVVSLPFFLYLYQTADSSLRLVSLL